MKPISLPRITLPVIAALALFLLGAATPVEPPDLRGRVTAEELYRASPVFKENARAYKPQAEALRAIARTAKGTKIVAFLGTWCLASQSEIPALLKTLELARNPNITLELYAVDRDIDEGMGLAAAMGVGAAPTVIVFQDGREAGRIRGLAKESMEEDLARILGTAQGR